MNFENEILKIHIRPLHTAFEVSIFVKKKKKTLKIILKNSTFGPLKNIPKNTPLESMALEKNIRKHPFLAFIKLP